jgi:phage-related protein
MSDTPLVWVGSSLDDMRSFPVEACRVAGYQLRRVQAGLMPEDWKSLASVGVGVCEIRVHAGTEHRVVYVARFAEAVYVLHSFTKKTGRTTQKDIELAKTRLGEVIRQRRE